MSINVNTNAYNKELNSFMPVEVDKNGRLNVNISSGGISGGATEAKQDDIINELDSIDNKITSCDTSNLATESTLGTIETKIPTLGPKVSAGSISVVNTSSGFNVQTRADEQENTAKSNSHLIAIGGYRDNNRTVANQRFGAVAINNNGQLETEIKNTSLTVDSSDLTAINNNINDVVYVEDLPTGTSGYKGLLTMGRHETSARTLNDGDAGAIALTSSAEVRTNSTQIENVSAVEGVVKPGKGLNIMGSHQTTLSPFLTDGQSAVPRLTSEAVLINSLRCNDATFNDNINNTEKVPLSCDGSGLISFPSINLMYNEDINRWQRLRGDLNGLMVNDSLRVKRKQGKCYTASTESNSTGDPIILSLLNPSGSGVTCYLYNINAHLSVTSSSVVTIQMSCDSITSHTSTTNITPTNLKLGGSASSAECKAELTASTVDSNIFKIRSKVDTTTPLIIKYDDFQEEFIEIPEGYGVQLSYDNNTSENVNYSATFRYYEE